MKNSRHKEIQQWIYETNSVLRILKLSVNFNRKFWKSVSSTLPPQRIPYMCKLQTEIVIENLLLPDL